MTGIGEYPRGPSAQGGGLSSDKVLENVAPDGELFHANGAGVLSDIGGATAVRPRGP